MKNNNVIFIGKNSGDSFYELFDIIKSHIAGDCLQEVSTNTKVHVTTLRNWREGKVGLPRLVNLIKIANYYGYSVRWIRRK